MKSTCPSCQTELLALTRWCNRCGVFLANPEVGRLAPPFRRLFANLADFAMALGAVLVLVLGYAPAIIMGATAEGSQPGGFATFMSLVAILLGFAGFLSYMVWALVLFASRGMTPGKKLLGVRVVQDDGAGFFHDARARMGCEVGVRPRVRNGFCMDSVRPRPPGVA